MNYLMVLSIVTGTLCGIWAGVAPVLGLLIWAGFAGCTTFFAAGGKKQGVKTSLITIISGFIWASLSICLINYLDIPMIGPIVTGLATFMMCAQGRFKYLSFIPGAFVGSYSTFASNGAFIPVIISLIVGVLLGYMCEKITIIICEKKEIKMD